MIQKKIAFILGARPNFVKAAPLMRRAKEYPNLKFILIHTGQHFDDNMSKVFFEQMEIPRPEIMLDIKGEFHTEKIGKMFSALDKVFADNKFDEAIVVGDVNSTLAGALAAVKNHCKLIHVEAGLRSHDRRMPEEINRAIVDHLAELLFTSEPEAEKNLILEGIAPDKIKYVGNVMIECLEIFKDQIAASNILSDLKLLPQQYAVATIHRVENTDNIVLMRDILRLLTRVNEDIPIVFPLHPGTKMKIDNHQLSHMLDKLIIVEPLGYFDFNKLVLESRGAITDSGGIQEETTHMGVACCTLRDNTERPITVTLGSNRLFPLDKLDADEVKKHLSRTDFPKRSIPLWDSEVSNRIFKYL